MSQRSIAARAGLQGDDTLIVIRQDGDLLHDNRASHEVGGLLRSKALGITLPAPQAIPIYQYARPDSPPVQSGMGYVIRTDPPMPRNSRSALNYVLPHLFEAFLAESTTRQQQAKRTRMIWLGALLTAAIFAFAVAFVVLPLAGVGVPEAAPETKSGGNATMNSIITSDGHFQYSITDHDDGFGGGGPGLEIAVRKLIAPHITATVWTIVRTVSADELRQALDASGLSPAVDAAA